MALGALGVGVFAAYVNFTPAAQHIPPALRKPEVEPKVPQTDVSVKPIQTPKVQTKLLVATIDGSEVRLVEATSLPSGVTPMVYAATQSLHNLGVEKARALGVDIHDRKATIDFSPELYQGFGSMEESQVVEALQLAMGQFPEIDTFEMRVDGQKVDTLGQLDLSDPIPVKRESSGELGGSDHSKPGEVPPAASPR